MALRRFFRSVCLGLSLVAVAWPHLASADCPLGSGIEFPFLTDDQLDCQRVGFDATLEYFTTFMAAREDCFYEEISGQVAPQSLSCLAPITTDGPETTGDETIDKRLRAAESTLTRRILTHCTNVDLKTLGFPGFCTDVTPETPYNAFDHVH